MLSCLLPERAQTDADCVRVSIETLAIREGGHDGPQTLEAVRSDCLRRYVLLERERIDAAELTCIPVGGQSVVRPRRVVSATATHA